MDLTGGVEIWAPCPGYRGRYEVSSHGQVRALARMGMQGELPARILDIGVNQHSTRVVTLRSADDVRRVRTVGGLVLRAFLGTPVYARRGIVHKDKSRANCRLDNLKWARLRAPKCDAVHGFTSWGMRRKGSLASIP